MSERQKKRWWVGLALVAGLALVIVVPLVLYLFHISETANRRGVIMMNESAAVSTLNTISAAQQAYLEVTGQYATFDQMVEAQVIGPEFAGSAPVIDGYVFTMKVTPGTETERPFFSVNADPQVAGGDHATGTRHYYLDSNTVGIRVNNERPATAGDRQRE
jgi:hypothetical protein